MKLARIALLATAVAALLVAGLYILAVPAATCAWKPPFPRVTPAERGLAYRDLVLRGAGGTRLPAWLVSAAGGTAARGVVLLLAENGGNAASPRMLWLADEVSRRGFDALLVDLRGHGRSSGVNTYGLGETRDLLAVLAALRAEAPERPIAAAGFSLGAACILRTMTVTDAIRAAVVFAPYARLDRELIRHELSYQTAGSRLGSLTRLVSAAGLLESVRLWAGFPRLPEPQDLVTNRPVLLFHCTGDPEIPFADARAIAARARAPLLEVQAVDRAMHLPPLSDDAVWQQFLGAIEAMLAGIRRAGE